MSPSTAPANSPSQSDKHGGDALSIAPVLSLLAVLTGGVGVGLWLRTRFSHHIVNGDSMAPTLRDNDWILVQRTADGAAIPRAGDIVIARDPRDPTRELVKRIDYIDLHGNAWLLGDNAPYSTDSRVFGAVPMASVTGRVRWRYWPLRR